MSGSCREPKLHERFSIGQTTNQVFPGLGLDQPNSGPGQKALLQTLTTGNTFQIVKVTTEHQAQLVRLFRANGANVDPTNVTHMAIMATPVNHEDNMTPDVITHALNQVIDQMMPRHALQRVQHYLGREYRKPAEMRVRDYYQRLVFINAQELPKLPPFGAGAQQWFNDADLIDILLFATPKKWQREMDRMGFDPLTKTSSDLLAFMENCEAIEDYDTTRKTVAHKPNNSKNGNKKGAKLLIPRSRNGARTMGGPTTPQSIATRTNQGSRRETTSPRERPLATRRMPKVLGSTRPTRLPKKSTKRN